ncbi:MAG: TRAP transporter small permease subunit [Hyphomonadaceae bacterium]|nr:TRAP transporter small permease subunit [Hyphomonadaceae bacterium]
MDLELLKTVGLMLKAIGWVFLPFVVLPAMLLVVTRSMFLENFARSTIELIDQLSVSIAETIKWLLVALVVSVAFGVIALSIFGQAWTKFDESATYFHATVILLGSAATLLAGQHVRVDIFHTRMSPKSKALVEIIGFYALLLPFCLVLIWNAQSFVRLAWVSLEGSPESDGIQGLFVLKTLVSVFAVMMLVQGFSIACRAALLLTGKTPPELPNNIDPLFEDHEIPDAGL